MFLVTKEFRFAAAHQLTRYHGKCERLHGHNYRLHVSVLGSRAENGMAVDFVLLKKLVNEQIISQLDHYNLNDLIENPTAENVVEWIWNRLDPLTEKFQKLIDSPNFPPEIARLLRDAKAAKLDRIGDTIRLYELKLWETDSSFITFRGPHGKF